MSCSWRRPVAGVVAGVVAAFGSRSLSFPSLSGSSQPPLTAQADAGDPGTLAPDDDEYKRALALLAKAGFESPTLSTRGPARPADKPVLCAPFVPPNPCSTAQRVVVVGGGIMGSATAYSLARRNEGHQVTLIDTGHPIRSSWGQERAARLAYDEPMFVQMMQRAFMLWGELEQSDAAGRKVLRQGVRLDVASRGVLDSLKKTQEELGLSLTVFGNQEELDKRFPQIKLREGEEAVMTEGAALIMAASALEILSDRMTELGVSVRHDTTVQQIDTSAKTVLTDSGETMPYDKIVIAGGPWTNQLLKRAGLSLLPTVVSCEACEQGEYFLPREGATVESLGMDLDSGFPVTTFFHSDHAYAKPHVNGGVPGVKVSVHQQGDFLRNEEFLLPDATLPQMAMLNTARKARIQSYLNADPALGKAANESQRYSDSTRDQSQVSDPLMHGLILAVARDRFPDLGQPDMFMRCLYSNNLNEMVTGTHEYIVGQHPDCADLVVATGFSGDGFKFGSFIGELCADITLGVAPKVDGVTTRMSPANLPRYPCEQSYRGVPGGATPSLQLGGAKTS